MGSKTPKSTALLILIILLALPSTGCWETADEGTVQVQTIWGEAKKVIHPVGGGIWTIFVWGDDYYEVSTKSFTHTVNVGATTKDNAALTLNVAVTGHILGDDASILAHVRKFGLEPEDRALRSLQVLDGQVSTEVKNAISEHDAYAMLAQQQQIQQRILAAVQPILKSQLYIEAESIQLLGRPQFISQSIDTAASDVVAALKAKEAAQAQLDAEKIRQERARLQAATYTSSPQTYELEKLDRQARIAEAWAKHSGPLVFSGGQIQIPIHEGK